MAKKKTKTSKINNRQRAFVEAYIGEACMNARLAAELAGYKGSAAALRVSGCRLLKNPKVQAEIVAQRKRLRTYLTPEDIHQIWHEIATDREVDPKDRLTAVRDAGKASGMFTKRIEHSGAQPVQIVRLPDNGRGDDGV